MTLLERAQALLDGAHELTRETKRVCGHLRPAGNGTHRTIDTAELTYTMTDLCRRTGCSKRMIYALRDVGMITPYSSRQRQPLYGYSTLESLRSRLRDPQPPYVTEELAELTGYDAKTIMDMRCRGIITPEKTAGVHNRPLYGQDTLDMLLERRDHARKKRTEQ